MNELLLALTRGPVADPPWREFLLRLGEALEADYVTLILRQPREGDEGVVLNSVVLSNDVYDAYNRDYFTLDPFVDLPPGEVFTVDEFVALDEFHASDYYQNYLKPSGILHLMGADTGDHQGNHARLRLARVKGRPNFGAEQRALCKQVLPHLQQALRLHARIVRVESERSLFSGAVDQMAMGAVILDESARIRHANAAAQRLLEEGRWLQSEDGQLRLRNRSDNLAFRTLLDDVMRAHERAEPSFIKAFSLSSEPGRPGPGMLLRPLPLAPALDGRRNPSVAIFISDPTEAPRAAADVLTDLFGLTRAESNLALQLARGDTLDEACAALGVSRNTGKSHLSAVFAKTGVARQSGLVQLILRSVAPMASAQPQT